MASGSPESCGKRGPFPPGTASRESRCLLDDRRARGILLRDDCKGLQPSVRTLDSLLLHNPAESSKAESGGPNGFVEQFWHAEPDELS